MAVETLAGMTVNLVDMEWAFSKANAKTSAKALRAVLKTEGRHLRPLVVRQTPRGPTRTLRGAEVPHLADSVRVTTRIGTGRGSTLARVEVGIPKRKKGFMLSSKALAQETGTTAHRAQPFLVPVLESERVAILHRVGAAVGALIRSLGR